MAVQKINIELSKDELRLLCCVHAETIRNKADALCDGQFFTHGKDAPEVGELVTLSQTLEDLHGKLDLLK